MKKAIILILALCTLYIMPVTAQDGTYFGMYLGGNYSALTGVTKYEPKPLPGVNVGMIFSGRGKIIGWDFDLYYSFLQSDFRDFTAKYTFHFLGLEAMFKIYPFKKLGLNAQLGYQLNTDLGRYSSISNLFVRGFVLGIGYDITKRWTVDLSTWKSAQPIIEQSIKEWEQPPDGGLPQEVWNTYSFYLSSLSLTVTYRFWELTKD